MANPISRKDMVFYPEYLDGQMYQVWHGKKMLRDVPDHLLTPMINHKGSVYYVNELTKLEGVGNWFLPKRWFTRSNKQMWAMGFNACETEVCVGYCSTVLMISILNLWQDGVMVDESELTAIPVSQFTQNLPDFLDGGDDGNPGILQLSGTVFVLNLGAYCLLAQCRKISTPQG